MKYKDCITYDELYKAMLKCRRNVSWKDSVSNFLLHSVHNISLLEEELNNDSYKQKKPYVFQITTPKVRDILSVPFRDRVPQRSLNDNILYPVMTKSFILDNCACQLGKGNQFARKRLVTQLRRWVNKHGTEGYVLQIDIHKFYKSLSHNIINKMFKDKLDPITYKHVVAILEHQYSGDKGYNPGSQMVQIAGISILNALDHYIKEVLKVEIYEHYVDDLIFVLHSKEEAEVVRDTVKEMLSELGLEFNRKKTKIYTLQDGIPFLGYKFVVTKTGKVLQLRLSSNIKNAKRKYRHMISHTYRNGKITKEKIDESFADFLEGLNEGNNYWLKNKMIKWYKEMWKKYECNT